MQETHKISDLETVRLLSDPLKLRLLQAFAEAPKTTKRVAAELGESVTKLYRHVDALQDAGLLEVVDEQQKRGTVERTFQAVARRFEVDHALFNEDDNSSGTEAIREVIRGGETELLDALAKAGGEDDSQPIFMRIRGKASPEQIAELRQTLNAWLETIPSDEEAPDDDAQNYGGIIAFYPIY